MNTSALGVAKRGQSHCVPKIGKMSQAKLKGGSKCLKIVKKVAFNIASVASYVYILSGQNCIKNGKNSQFWRVFEILKLAVKQCYQIGNF